MKWRIYFYAYSLLTIIGVIFVAPSMTSLNLADYGSIIEGIILMIATGSYIYGKKIFPATVWRIIFTYLLILWTLQTLVSVVPIEFLNIIETSLNTGLGLALFSIALGAPAMLAMYRLGKGMGLASK
jgi:hypothetical protein